MNNISKRIVSTITAVVAAAAMSVTAFAANYGSEPSYPSTSPVAPSAPSNEVEESIENAINNSEADKEEGTATVEVENTDALVLSAKTVKKLKGTEDGKIEIVSPKVTISIDAESIEKAAKINLSSTVKNTSNSSTIKFNSRGSFGCEVKITLTDCKLSKAALKKAHVYRTVKNPSSGKTVTVDLGPVELDENGNPVIIATAGGEYTIT